MSRRGRKQSPARTTDVVMDTTDENETRIALVSFSSRLRLQLMLTLKTFQAGEKSVPHVAASLGRKGFCFPINEYNLLFVCLFVYPF